MRKSPIRSEEGGRFSLYCGFSLQVFSTLAFSGEWEPAKWI